MKTILLASGALIFLALQIAAVKEDASGITFSNIQLLDLRELSASKLRHS